MCGFSGSNSNWVLICRYWSGVLIGGMVGFDGYLSMGFDGYWLGWWWVLHPLMWCCNEWRSNERRWFRQVCFILSLMVARCGWFWICIRSVAQQRRRWLAAGSGCGWFWVCVGSVARRRRRWLVGCGWFCWRMGVGVARRILLKGGWLGVGVARWRRRVCEFVLEGRK